jgi:predicted lipoprotein with Yx(FWY)xxD motif
MKRLVLLVALAAGCATQQSSPFTYRNNILTTSDGRTLYTYAKDTSGKSACTGRCADVWPPYLVTNEGNAGGYFSVVTRDDGRRQWAFDGKPLYLNATDSRPGDRKGGGVDGVWSVVRSPATQSGPAFERPAVGTPAMGTRYEGS